MIHVPRFTLHDSRGIAALLAIVGVAALVLLIVISISVGNFFENDASSARQKNREAFFVAEAGVHEAIQRITRNKDYTTTITQDTFPIVSSPDTLSVTVTGTTTKTITATAVVKNRTGKIQATVTVDSNGLVTIASWQELSS
ncbi:hypothetical protein HY625_01635 [Candidatus Uhrbacteria bacterium]|nr:hypothetical protein [Candidatus Uhrbacteria bacterium]